MLFKKKISSDFLAGALGLSAGVMLFISLAELLPQSQALMAACWSGKGGGAMALVAFFIGMGVMITWVRCFLAVRRISRRAIP